MPKSTLFHPPLMVGRPNSNPEVDVGGVVVAQFARLVGNTVAVRNATIVVPRCRLLDITVDVITAFDGATSSTLTVGSSPASTLYAGGVDVKTTGRKLPVYTAAQLNSMETLATETSTIWVTVSSVGAVSTGDVNVIIQYSPIP